MCIRDSPLLYGTTENFLRCFNLNSLEELPSLPETENEETDKPEEETTAENTVADN